MTSLIDEQTENALLDALFGKSELRNSDDVNRWFNQGFSFSKDIPFGLIQKSGGPCGVLSIVQAFILIKLLFHPSFKVVNEQEQLLKLTLSTTNIDELHDALAHALSFLIVQATETEADEYVVVLRSTASQSYEYVRTRNITVLQKTIRDRIYQFSSNNGVILLLFSILLTRKFHRLTNDMDEPTPLIVRFGNCSQELLNLLLVGRATTGIHDSSPEGTQVSGLTLKGISKHPFVGLLSLLEAFSFAKVGEYLKNPIFPLFILGSESHFTLLFSLSSNTLQVSPKTRVQTSFSKFEQDAGSGMVNIESIASIMDDLLIFDERSREKIISYLSLEQGFVLFYDFWNSVRRLWREQREESNVDKIFYSKLINLFELRAHEGGFMSYSDFYSRVYLSLLAEHDSVRPTAEKFLFELRALKGISTAAQEQDAFITSDDLFQLNSKFTGGLPRPQEEEVFHVPLQRHSGLNKEEQAAEDQSVVKCRRRSHFSNSNCSWTKRG
jgi:Domain of unknown function (DUF4205)